MKNKYIYIIFVLGALLLLFQRGYAYFMYGPYGFGYDTGIYLKEFLQINSFEKLLGSQISFLPSLGAFLMNVFGIELDIYLYGFYIFCSVILGYVLYGITKRQFGLYAALVTFCIFLISYAQVYAVQFYLFKTILGASFLLLGLYLYQIKSRYLYAVFFVLALTQLPQLLILLAACALAGLFDFKRNKKFILEFYGVSFIALGILILLFNQQFLTAVNVVFNGLIDTVSYDKHLSGYFISFQEYLKFSYWIIVLALIGLFNVIRQNFKEWLVYLFAILFLFIIIVFSLFFEERYIFELDLLLIPFAGYGFVYLLNLMANKTVKTLVIGFFVIYITSLYGYYLYTTKPALTDSEVAAIEYINKAKDANSVFVINTFYAPWIYGFTNKMTLSPGIFESVMTFEEWEKFNNYSEVEKLEFLSKMREKYGNFYIYSGVRDSMSDFSELGLQVKYSITGAYVYYF